MTDTKALGADADERLTPKDIEIMWAQPVPRYERVALIRAFLRKPKPPEKAKE